MKNSCCFGSGGGCGAYRRPPPDGGASFFGRCPLPVGGCPLTEPGFSSTSSLVGVGGVSFIDERLEMLERCSRI